ncbi:TPA: neuroblastoma breakpoint family, member 3-like [Bos taurus]|nr:TPA: neuroblastoma breakpoint family, member 3-like [Bos taurus]
MAVCLPSLSDLRAERTLTEINQELRLQLAKYKQDFRDLTEKFLISQATSYSLANQLQKYKCEACKDIVESVLGEKLLFEVRRPAEKLAEKPTLDERLRTCATLIRSQARELTQLRQTLRDGKDDSVLLKQHLEDLLTRNDPDSHQGQGFRESLSEGYRVAKRLACKLSPEMYEDEEDEQAQEKLTPSMELQEVEKREVPEESKDECGLMPSSLQGSSDSHQPYSDDKFKFNELEVDLGQDGACGCSHAKEDEIPTKISDNENDHKQDIQINTMCAEKSEPLSRSSVCAGGQDVSVQGKSVSSFNRWLCAQCPDVNLQDDEEKVVFQQSQDECVSVPSTLREGSACNQPSSDGEFAFDEENVASAVDGACGCSQAEEDEIPTGLPENQNDHDDLKSPEVVAPRFSRQLPQMRENGVPRDSLDEYYLTYSVLPDLSDSFWPYRSNAIFSPEDVDVSYARDVTKNLADLEDEEDQDIISSSYGSRLTNSSCLTMGSPNPTNLSVEQLVVEENEVQPDSLDECYLAASVGHHLAGSCHPYRSASFPTERREVFLALDVNGDTWEDCHRGPVSFPGSEVPTSQAQLQESTHVTDCLQWQLDQHFDCGDSKAMLGLSSTNWGFTSNPDSGNQGPLFLELGASISMKNPPKLQVVFDGRDIDFFAEDRSVVYSKVYISQLSDHFLMINSGEPFLPRTPSSACCELPSAACGG